MSIFLWIVFGALAGLAAHVLDSQDARGGVMGSVGIGILGALVGGVIANILFAGHIMQFSLTTFITAAVASLILILTQRTLLSK